MMGSRRHHHCRAPCAPALGLLLSVLLFVATEAGSNDDDSRKTSGRHGEKETFAEIKDVSGKDRMIRLPTGPMVMPPTAAVVKTFLDPTTVPKYVTDLPIPTPWQKVRHLYICWLGNAAWPLMAVPYVRPH